MAARVAEGRREVIRPEDGTTLSHCPVPVTTDVLSLVRSAAVVQVFVVVGVRVDGQRIAHLERAAEQVLAHVTHLRGDHEEGGTSTCLLQIIQLLAGEFGRWTVVKSDENDLLVLGLGGRLLQPLIHHRSRVDILVGSPAVVRPRFQTVDVLDDSARNLKRGVIRRRLGAGGLGDGRTNTECAGGHRTARQPRRGTSAAGDAGLRDGALRRRRLRR